MSHHAHTPEVHEHADAWHHHAEVEGAPQAEHTAVVNTGSLAKWFVILVVTLTVVLVAISVYFTAAVTRAKAEKLETTALGQAAREAKLVSLAQLSADGSQQAHYAWADATAGQVQIPIAKAMDKVVAKYATRTK